MDIENIKKRIATEIGVVRLPAPELNNIDSALRMFEAIGNEFLQKKEKKYDLNVVMNEAVALIKWAYMLPSDSLMDFSKGLLIKGHTGVGKTFLFRVFNYFVKYDDLKYMENGKVKQMGAFVANVKKIAGEFQASEGGYSVIQKYANTPCLVLDDIGKEQDKSLSFGNKLNVVAEIIDIREELGMLTFGTTNVEDLSTLYDDRTISRMHNLFNVMPITSKKDLRIMK